MASLFDSPSFQPLNRVAGKPAITVTKNGVGFSKQALSKLEYTHYVQMFINKNDKQLGIRKCEKDAPGAMKFVPEKKDMVDSLRWNNPSFTGDIKSLVEKELADIDFTCEGSFIEDEGMPALLFDFTKAHPLKNRSSSLF